MSLKSDLTSAAREYALMPIIIMEASVSALKAALQDMDALVHCGSPASSTSDMSRQPLPRSKGQRWLYQRSELNVAGWKFTTTADVMLVVLTALKCPALKVVDSYFGVAAILASLFHANDPKIVSA